MKNQMKGSTPVAPVVIAAFVIAMGVAMYGLNLDMIMSVAVAMFASAAVAGFGGDMKTTIALGALGVIAILFSYSGMLTAAITEPTIITGTYSVSPATVTAGTSLSASTFTIPLTYNSTAATVDKDTFEVSFDITRTDVSVDDSTCVITVIEPLPTVIDTSNGLEYQIVEKDTLQNYKVYVNDSTSNIQTLSRTLPFKFGTKDAYTVRVKYDLNGGSFAYSTTYTNHISTIDVCGTTYLVNIQKTATVT